MSIIPTVLNRPPRAAAAFSPFDLGWHTAVWADDPAWVNPGDGNPVSSWRDGSGNGRNLTQGTGANQPTFRASVAGLNNKAAVDFDGASDILAVGPFTSVPQTFTFVWVGKRDGAGAGGDEQVCSLKNNDAPYTQVLMRTTSSRWALYGGTSFITDPVYTTNKTAIRAKFAGASTELNVNGTAYTGSAGTGDATYVSLGGYGASTNCANMHVAFAGLYVGDITAHGSWASFVSWVNTQYGVTIA